MPRKEWSGHEELKNVVLLPHVGSATFEIRTNMAHVAVQKLLAGLAGALPPHCINPAVYTSTKTRA